MHWTADGKALLVGELAVPTRVFDRRQGTDRWTGFDDKIISMYGRGMTTTAYHAVRCDEDSEPRP